MSEIEFYYKGKNTTIQCNSNDKLKDIIQKFLSKISKKEEEIYYLYGGKNINENLTFLEHANNDDKKRNKMSILVYDGNKENNPNLKKSKNLICPLCQENIRMKIKDYKITLYDCKNGHKINNILLNEFEKTQYIDESKIICQLCKNTNKNETYNNKFFICFSCKINLCPLCKDKHDKTHNIIDYDQKYFICNLHNESFFSYCSSCKKNICLMCENDHIEHKLISYGKLLRDRNDLNNKLNNFKIKVNEFKDNIKNIIIQLNNLMEKLDIYYNIYENIVNIYDNRNRNYQIL